MAWIYANGQAFCFVFNDQGVELILEMKAVILGLFSLVYKKNNQRNITGWTVFGYETKDSLFKILLVD